MQGNSKSDARFFYRNVHPTMKLMACGKTGLLQVSHWMLRHKYKISYAFAIQCASLVVRHVFPYHQDVSNEITDLGVNKKMKIKSKMIHKEAFLWLNYF